MSTHTREPTLAELSARLERLEQLVLSLRDGDAPLQTTVAAAQTAHPLAQHHAGAAARTSATSVTDSSYKTLAAMSDASSSTTSVESVGRAKFLGAVGVLCFILAGSYFIRLAISEGWITPIMQLTAVVVFGIALIALGLLMRDKDQQYASLLPGAGIVLLYMAAYGGHLYFSLYDLSVASFVVNVVSLVCLWLYASFRTHTYALVASAGTYMMPLLLGDATWSFAPLCVYLMVWNVTFSVIAAFLGSRILLSLTAYMAILLISIMSERLGASELAPGLARLVIFQALQFVFFCSAIAWYSIRRREPLSHAEAWALFPLLLLFYLSETELMTRLWPTITPWCALAFGVWIYTLYALSKRFFGVQTLQSFPMIACFLSIIAVHVVYQQLLPTQLRPWCAVGILVWYALFSRHRVSGALQQTGAAVFVLSLIPLIEYAAVLFGPAGDYSPAYKVLLNFAFAGAVLMVAHEAAVAKSSLADLLRVLGAGQFLLGLRNLSRLLFEPVTAALATSALWSAVALVVLLSAQRLGDRGLASKASWLFGLTAIKVLLFDLSESGAGGRIAALIVIGALFYAGGYVYQWIGANNKA